MTKLNVLVSLITDANDYQLEQAASAQSAAVQLGASVQIIYSRNDAVQQTQQILDFVQNSAKRPDAILVEPVGTGMAQIATAAVTAGIAWAPGGPQSSDHNGRRESLQNCCSRMFRHRCGFRAANEDVRRLRAIRQPRREVFPIAD